ncbi:MAG: Ig-like domain-containing protein [Candidatus Muiribacteriota bacterium]
MKKLKLIFISIIIFSSFIKIYSSVPAGPLIYGIDGEEMAPQYAVSPYDDEGTNDGKSGRGLVYAYSDGSKYTNDRFLTVSYYHPDAQDGMIVYFLRSEGEDPIREFVYNGGGNNYAGTDGFLADVDSGSETDVIVQYLVEEIGDDGELEREVVMTVSETIIFDNDPPEFVDLDTGKDDHEDVKIYEPVELIFNEDILFEVYHPNYYDPDEELLETQWDIRTDLDKSSASHNWEYVQLDPDGLEIDYDDPSILIFNHSHHWFRPKSNYHLRIDKVWDKAGNELSDHQVDVINELFFSTDSTPTQTTNDGPGIFPGDGNTNISIEPIIKVTFDERIDELSFINAFSITPKVEGYFNFIYERDRDIHTAFFFPDEKLRYSQEYIISINKNLRDVAGINFEGTSWSFTTQVDDVPPQIIEKYPVEGQVGLPPDSEIYIQFNEPMLKNSLNNTNIKLFDGDDEVAVIFDYDESNSRLYLKPVNPLFYSRVYKVKVTTAVKDIAGNNLENPVTWNFSTISENAENPEVSNVNFLLQNETDYSFGTIEITFSKDMNLEDVLNPDNYVLNDEIFDVPIMIMQKDDSNYRDFKITTRRFDRPESYYPEYDPGDNENDYSGVFHFDRNYRLSIKPHVKDSGGINLISAFNKTMRSTDTIEPYVKNTYPADKGEIYPYQNINTLKIYFNEDVNLKSDNISHGYNAIPVDSAGEKPVYIEYSGPNSLPDNLDGFYVNEKEDNIDLNNNGEKKDFILEIYNEDEGERQPLPAGNYTVFVKDEVSGIQIKDEADNLLNEDYEFEFEILADTNGPTVDSISVDSMYNEGYPVDLSIMTEFSKPLNKLNLSSEAFKIEYDLTGNGINDGTVETDVYYYSEYVNGYYKYMVEVVPRNLLPKGADCKLIIKADKSILQDESENPIYATSSNPEGNDYSYSFNTSEKPVVLEHFPKANEEFVSIDSYILFKFSEDMKPDSINFMSIAVNDGVENIPGILHYDEDNKTGYFYPADQLRAGAEFTVSIGVSDKGTEYSPRNLDGETLAYNKVWKFTTANQPDETPPEVLSTKPVAMATNMPVLKSDENAFEFEVTFSKQMDNTTANGRPRTISADPPVFRVFYLDENEEEVELTDPFVEYDENTQKATFSFVKELENDRQYHIPLQYNTVYYAELATSVTDMAGNRLNNRGTIQTHRPNYYVWSFKTQKNETRPTGGFVRTSFQQTDEFRFMFSERMKVTGHHSLKSFVDITTPDYPDGLPTEFYEVSFEHEEGDQNPFDGPGGTDLIPNEDYSYLVIEPSIQMGDYFENNEYRITINRFSDSSELTDTAGNLFYGATEGDIEAGDEDHTNIIKVSDDIRPYVLNWKPDGENVSTNPNVIDIMIEFSHQIIDSEYGEADFQYSIKNPSNFYILQEEDNFPLSNTDIEYNSDSNEARLILSDNLDFETDYKVIVKNVKDLDGNMLEDDEKSFTFATREPSPPRVDNIEILRKDDSQPGRITHVRVHFLSDLEMDAGHFYENRDSLVSFRKANAIENWPVTYTWEQNNTVLLLTLDRMLDFNSRYILVLSGNMQDIEGNEFDGNENRISEGDPVDNYIYELITAPSDQYLQVIHSNPYDKKEGVEVDNPISVFFNHPIARTSITYERENGTVFLTERDSVEQVEADLTFLNEDKIMVINPSKPLKTDTEYRLVITANVRRICPETGGEGDGLDGNQNNVWEDSPTDDFQITFNTGKDSEKPKFIAGDSNPEDGTNDYGIQSGVELVFSKELSSETLNNLNNFVKIYPGTTGYGTNFSEVEYTYNYQEENNRQQININPSMPFACSSYYTVRITSGIKDKNGNFLENPSKFTFRTRSNDFDFTAFKNPGANDEIFMVVKHSENMDLNIKLKQFNKSPVNLDITKTNSEDGKHIWFSTYRLNTSALGKVNILAEGQIGSSTLRSSLYMDYGYINQAPMLLADGILKASSDNEEAALIFYNSSGKKEINKASPLESEIEELKLFTWEYEIVTGNDKKVHLNLVPEAGTPENTGLYSRNEKGEWVFESRLDENLNVNLSGGQKFALLKDEIGPRIKMKQQMFENPEFEVEDISGYRINRISVNNESINKSYFTQNKEIEPEKFKKLEAGYHNVEVSAEDGVGNITVHRGPFLAPGPFEVGKLINYPNPASNYTTIKYSIKTAQAQRALLEIFDSSGRRIYNKSVPKTNGTHKEIWNLIDRRGNKVANGVYFYVISIFGSDGEKDQQSSKMAVLR